MFLKEKKESNKIKVLIVEPDKKPYVKEIENTLEEKQKIVGGLIYFYEAEKNVDFIWNEEGKELDLEFNRVIEKDVIAGTFIIAGQENGESISLTRKQIKKYKKHFAVKRDAGTIALLRQEVKRSSDLSKFNMIGVEKLRDFLILDKEYLKEHPELKRRRWEYNYMGSDKYEI